MQSQMVYMCIHIFYIYLWCLECDEADLTEENGTTNTARCADRGFVNISVISDGVVCYNGTTVGSRAVYVCNDGFLLVGNEARVCQNDVRWNGSMPQCIPGMYCSTLTLVQKDYCSFLFFFFYYVNIGFYS